MFSQLNSKKHLFGERELCENDHVVWQRNPSKKKNSGQQSVSAKLATMGSVTFLSARNFNISFTRKQNLSRIKGFSSWKDIKT